MSRLQENLDEILRQKQTYLKPENLRQGITAYGIEGQMTSENMWLPQYAPEGDYYILSFVNLDGNSNVEKIVGYDGYRIVKFYNDTRWYIFDFRMNKPTYYIGTPIYYPRDKLHIGHAYSTTIADNFGADMPEGTIGSSLLANLK